MYKEIPLTAPTNRDTVLESDHGEVKLLATAAVLLALTPQWVDSATTAISHSKGHVVMKVGCSTNWWGAISTVNISLPHPREVHVLHTVFKQIFISKWSLVNENILRFPVQNPINIVLVPQNLA